MTKLVNTSELWFVPVANPDGYDFTFTPGNRLWRKNLRDNNGDGADRRAVDGVDLNRNFADQWGYDNEGSSPDPPARPTAAPAPLRAGDPGAGRPAATRSASSSPINYHSAAELLLYGVGWQVDPRADDDPVFEALSGTDGRSGGDRRRPGDPGLRPGSRAELYTTNGETTDHAYTRVRHARLHAGDRHRVGDSARAGDCRAFNFPDDEALIQAGVREEHPVRAQRRGVGRQPGRAAQLRREHPGRVPGQDHAAVRARHLRRVVRRRRSSVEVNAKRSLGEVTLKYRLNGHGPTYTVPTRELRGGERYGEVRRPVLPPPPRHDPRPCDVGDSVEVWWQARKAKSTSFTFKVVYDAKGGRSGVLLLAAEDYTGNPGRAVRRPALPRRPPGRLRANGIDPDVYDVDAKSRVAPHPLGVLSHFNAVVWYTGDDVIPRDPTQGPGTASRLAHDEIARVRDFINEGGRVFASGENLPYAHMNGYPYPPGPTAPVPLHGRRVPVLLRHVPLPGWARHRQVRRPAVQPFGSLFDFADFTPDTLGDTANPSQILHTTSSFLPARRTRTSPAPRSRSTSSSASSARSRSRAASRPTRPMTTRRGSG